MQSTIITIYMPTNEQWVRMSPLIVPKLPHHIPNIDRFSVPLLQAVEAEPFLEDQSMLLSTNCKYENETNRRNQTKRNEK